MQATSSSAMSDQRPLSLKIVMWVLYIVCRLLSSTWRIRFVGMDRRRMTVGASPTGSFLIGIFHENSIAGLLSHENHQICNMVSQSKDGEIVDFIVRKYGLTTVRGSSSRGGKAVREAMIEQVNAGVIGAIAVDGPRGPRRVLKNGIADIARKTGAPIVPVTTYGQNNWILKKTWDKTRIPKPFSKIIIYYGEPIFVPKDAKDEQFNEYLTKITDVMNRDDDLVRLRFDDLWANARA